MSHATATRPVNAVTASKPRSACSAGFRVLAHEPICPDCRSLDVTTQDVDTGDGLTETALICRQCGAAWPLCCVTEWTGR